MLLPLYLGGKLYNSKGFNYFMLYTHVGEKKTLKIHLNGKLFVSSLSLITNALKQIILKLCEYEITI